MTRVLALADQSKIGCITQRRFAKVGTKTHPQRGADLDRNGLSVSTETACRFEPKSPVGNSEICTHVEVAPGVVIVVAAWMLDPAACAGMELGAPRVAVSALAELHRLLVEVGFRNSSQVDRRVVLEK